MREQFSNQDLVTIATANTHFGDMIRAKEGLNSIKQHAPDILLLQEVINPTDQLEQQLGEAGYSLVHALREFGLAMAIRAGSKLSVIPGSVRAHKLQKMGPIERTLAQRWARSSHAMKGHGMQAAQFETQSGQVIIAINTRTTVSSNRLARRRQIMKMGKELEGPYYAGPLVVGGDMNHFPSPRQIDTRMHEGAGLKQVDLGNEPTWRARNSPMYRIIARVRRQRIEGMCAQLDALLYRGEGLELGGVKVVDTVSDHRAIVGRFELGTRKPASALLL